MGAAHGYATGNIADADFGSILELITGDYAAMLPKFHGIVQADSKGLGHERDALDSAADAYKAADARSRNHFTRLDDGSTVATADDGVANGFDDVTSAQGKLVPPSTVVSHFRRFPSENEL